MKLVVSDISYDVGMMDEFSQSQSILALHVRNVKDAIVSQGLNYLMNPGSFSCFLSFIDAVRQNVAVFAFTQNLPILIATLSLPSVRMIDMINGRCLREGRMM